LPLETHRIFPLGQAWNFPRWKNRTIPDLQAEGNNVKMQVTGNHSDDTDERSVGGLRGIDISNIHYHAIIIKRPGATIRPRTK
jgi:hypothetical protein